MTDALTVSETVYQPSLCDTLRPTVTPALLNTITERIVSTFHPDKIILFGSYAYGTPHSESDVDLLVIMNSDKTPHERIVAVTAIAKIPYLPMDILVKTPQEVNERLAIGDFFIQDILSQGRVLYANESF